MSESKIIQPSNTEQPVDPNWGYGWSDVVVTLQSGSWAILLVLILAYSKVSKPLGTFYLKQLEVLSLLKDSLGSMQTTQREIVNKLAGDDQLEEHRHLKVLGLLVEIKALLEKQ